MNERLLIAILTAVQFTHMTDFVVMMPLAPTLMKAFAITPQQFGSLVSCYTYAAGVGAILGAAFIDRLDRKRALLGLYAGFAIATLGCALAPDHHWMMAARIVAGACGGLLGALVMSIVGDYVPYQRRGAATGMVMAGFAIASVLGVPAGLFLAEAYDWHAPFFLIAGLAAVVFVIAVVGLAPMRAHLKERVQRSAWNGLRVIMSDANHLRAFAFMVMMVFAGFIVIPFISPYLVGNVGYPKSKLAYVYLIGGICTVVTSPIIGRLSDRFGKHRIFAIVALLSMVPILVLTHLPPVSVAAALTLAAFFIILVNGRFVPAMAITTSAVALEHRGSFMSFNSAFQSAAMGLGVDLAGMTISEGADGRLTGYGTVGIVAAACTALAVVLAMLVKTRHDAVPPLPAKVEPQPALLSAGGE